MNAAVVFPLVVGLTFGVAGVAKLADVRRTREAFARFRLPHPFARAWFVIGYALVEVVTGLALVSGLGIVFGVAAVVAVVQCSVFLVLVARAYHRREAFECGCFGSISHSRISGWLVARNAVLLAAAVAGLATWLLGFPGVPLALRSFTLGDAAWLSLVVLATAAAFALLERLAAATPSVPTPAVPQGGAATPEAPIRAGDTVPDIQVVGGDGSVRRIRDLARQKPQLIVFVKAGCFSCDEVLDNAAELAWFAAPHSGVVFAVDAAKSVFAATFPELAEGAVYGTLSAQEKLGISALPAALVLGVNGVILAAPVFGVDAVISLAGNAASLGAAQLGAGVQKR